MVDDTVTISTLDGDKEWRWRGTYNMGTGALVKISLVRSDDFWGPGTEIPKWLCLVPHKDMK